MGICVATETTSVWLGDTPYTIRKGEAWPDDHPVVVKFPGSFSTDGRHTAAGRDPNYVPTRGVEDATARPGERRRRAG